MRILIVSDAVPVLFLIFFVRLQMKRSDHPVCDQIRRKIGIIDLQVVFKPDLIFV